MSVTFAGKNASEWRSGDLICLIGSIALLACCVSFFAVYLFVCLFCLINQHNEHMHTIKNPGVKDVWDHYSGSILNRKSKPP